MPVTPLVSRAGRVVASVVTQRTTGHTSDGEGCPAEVRASVVTSVATLLPTRAARDRL